MLRLSRRSFRPSVLPCCSAEDEDIAPCGAANTKGARAEGCAQTAALRGWNAHSPQPLESGHRAGAGPHARIAKVSPRRAAPDTGCDVFAQFCGSRVGGIDACRLPTPAIGLPSFDGISRPLAVVAVGRLGVADAVASILLLCDRRAAVVAVRGLGTGCRAIVGPIGRPGIPDRNCPT